MNRIKELRENKNLTQEQLAKMLNVAQNTLSYWENNKINPNIDALKKMREIFGVSTDDILGHEPLIKIEIKEGAGAYTASQIEKLLDDAKQALDAAVQEGHITEEQAIEASDLARQQLELIAKKK